MATYTYGVSISGGSLQISASLARSANHSGDLEIPLPAGAAGELTTRTNDTEGTITAASAGHGIETADEVDVYWDGGMRYGVTVGTVAGTAIPISGGAGDDLPAEETNMVVSKQVEINAAIDGDELVLIALVATYLASSSTAKSHADMQDSGDDTIEEVDLPANVPQVYDIQGGTSANPFTGNPITKILASNGSATEAATLKAIWLVDATP